MLGEEVISQQSTVNSQQSTVNSQQSTVNSQQSLVRSKIESFSHSPTLPLSHSPTLPLSPSDSPTLRLSDSPTLRLSHSPPKVPPARSVCHWAGDRVKMKNEAHFDRKQVSNFLEEIVLPRSGSSPLFLLH
jgi:hypothetical protein